MENLIYYPTFEPLSKEWIKFSLLYFEEFSPIIPYNRQNQVSADFRRVIEETDLIRPFSPDYLQGARASVKTIEEANQMFSSSPFSRLSFKKGNLLKEWQKPENWSFCIYEEKFSHELLRFCQKSQIGQQSNGGLILPEELAFMFMTNLAKEISYDNNSAVITDNIKFDNYTNTSRILDKSTIHRTMFAKSIINLLVPKNLGEIEYKKLIKFRNENRELIRSFNGQIDNMQNAIENGFTSGEFIRNFNNIYSDFSKEILLQGIGVASIPFAAYILMNNPQALTAEYIKEVLGGLGIVLGGTYSFNKLWTGNKNKRYCKKYLTNLGALS